MHATWPADATRTLELIVDGYAHVLVLDVDRRSLERDVRRLAEMGDPTAAQMLRELSLLLRAIKRATQELRDALSAARARAEARR